MFLSLARDKMKDHTALLMMLVAAVATFGTNVIIKNNYDDDVYIIFTMLAIYIGYVTSLSFFGGDNLVLRYSEIVEKKVDIPLGILKQIALSIVAALALVPIFGFSQLNSDGLPFLFYFLISIAITINVGCSVLLRLSSYFFSAQLAINAWKVFLFVFVFIASLIKITTLDFIELIFGALAISMFVALWLFIKTDAHKNITINRQDVSYKFGFQLASILSFCFFLAVDSVDRVIVSRFISEEPLANYLYFVTLFLFPIGVFSSYLGYKELVYIKNGSDIDLETVLKRNSVACLVLYMLYTIAMFAISDFISLKFDGVLWGLILIIAITKIQYSILSAVMGAKGTALDINRINVITLSLLSVLILLSIQTGFVYAPMVVVTFVWIVRFGLYLKSCQKILSNS